MDEVSRFVLALTDEEIKVLEAQIGDDGAGIRRAASRERRRPRGRVVVLHCLMGAKLDVVDTSGDADRVWFSIPRLAFGGLADLQLTPSFSPTKPGIRVATSGMFAHYYLKLLLTLHEHWETLPFDYDWRLDIDDSAKQLATTIRELGPR